MLLGFGPVGIRVEQSWPAAAWATLGPSGQLSAGVLGAVLVVVVLVLLVRAVVRLGPVGRRRVVVGLTAFFFICSVVFTLWAERLPEPIGTSFVLWHQGVRVFAALAVTAFTFCSLLLALPWAFDLFEGRGFVSFIAVRHVRATKSGFLTMISGLSIAGVFLSSLALCGVVSVMGGFGADLKRKILGNNAHITIDSIEPQGFRSWETVLGELRGMNGIGAATPVATGEAMASSHSNTAGLVVRGVEPGSIASVIDLLKNIDDGGIGSFDYLSHPEKLTDLPEDALIGIGPGGERYFKGPKLKPWLDSGLDQDVVDALAPSDVHPGIIVGRELAKTLHVYVGDEVTLVAPVGDLGPMGIMPRSRKFRVAAIFYSGMYEYDASQAYVLLDEAQDFLDLDGRITQIDVKVPNAEDAVALRSAVEQALVGHTLRIRDWKEMNKNLFSALKLEKIATFIVLSLAIAVASFCIICTLLLMVTEKSKEIAILKAIGASDRAILSAFVLEGLIIGAIGTVFGVVTGFVLMASLKFYGVRLDPDVYYVDKLPISVNLEDYLLVALSALLITMAATIYPALAASRLRPVDGIRYE